MPAPGAATGERVRFNPLRPDFRRDPYPTYARLRSAAPAHRALGTWVITRHADVRALLGDRGLGVGVVPDQLDQRAAAAGLTDGGRPDGGRLGRLARTSLVFTDDPAHARLRALVHRAITPRAVEARRTSVARIAARLWAAAPAEADVVADLAGPLPYAVLADWLGLPAELHGQVAGWTHDVRFLLDPGVLHGAELVRVATVVDTVVDAFVEVVRHRRTEPGTDLISSLVGARTRDGDALTDEEIAFVALMCFVAGGETTTALIATTVLALLRHPEQAARYRERRELRPGAVVEALRWDSPLQMTKRVAHRDLEVAGTPVAAGETLLLCLAAANRDPDAFDEPDAFRIDRDPSGQLGFGVGMHGCLGAALARAQAEIAVEAVLADRPTLVDDAVTYQDHSLIVRGPARLPVARPFRGGAS